MRLCTAMYVCTGRCALMYEGGLEYRFCTFYWVQVRSSAVCPVSRRLSIGPDAEEGGCLGVCRPFFFVLPTIFEYYISEGKGLRARKQRVKWMNPRASTNEAYTPTYIEHLANVVTHGIWVVPSLLGGLELVKRSLTWTQLVSAWVYGTSLLLVFAVSTFFHSVHYCNHTQLKDVLHRCDRAMIYVFIAATYFPWLMIEDCPDNIWLPMMRYIVWIMATLGILYQQVFHERYKMLETIFYLVMGIGPSVAVISVNKFDNIGELKTGGLIYIVGIVFFKSDGRIPCAHAIWHLFVAGGAGFHYYAILRHLYPATMDQLDGPIGGPALPDLFDSQVEL